jgi:hypothetical protein
MKPRPAYVFFKHEDQAEGPALAARFLHLAGVKQSRFSSGL